MLIGKPARSDALTDEDGTPTDTRADDPAVAGNDRAVHGAAVFQGQSVARLTQLPVAPNGGLRGPAIETRTKLYAS